MIALLLTACKKSRELPPGILPPAQMTEILAQIHLLESKVERLGLPSDSALQVYRYYEQELFCHQAGTIRSI
ncbi:MAG: DUF4296 domain-containing protein [Cytophagales bacterium]|nr:DUF4296 domain-containing protein [Cytophagales bacterium]